MKMKPQLICFRIRGLFSKRIVSRRCVHLFHANIIIEQHGPHSDTPHYVTGLASRASAFTRMEVRLKDTLKGPHVRRIDLGKSCICAQYFSLLQYLSLCSSTRKCAHLSKALLGVRSQDGRSFTSDGWGGS
jgi:hypothetical protein